MSKINRYLIILLILFLALLVPLWMFMKAPVNAQNPVQEIKVGGLIIKFEEGTTEPEVKAILENYDMPRDWIIKYNVDYMGELYYVKVDEDMRDKLDKEGNWNDPVYPEIPEPRFPEIKKGNYSYIIVSQGYFDNESFQNESFLKVMEKHSLQMKKSVVCYILFGDGSQNWNEPKNWIPERDAIRIKNELEMNEKVMLVSPDYIEE
ncbi:UPF0228 family protein [Methanosarcina sp. T3]|uniref:UPF0228 family protein n=1 Tax=Methanosarcina sp. T3 TaxID=3439062 RepID=UPI003F86D6BD